MPNRITLLALATAAFALPATATAADKPPTQPPASGGGTGSTGGSPAKVPEPEQMLLFGVAFAGLIAARRLHRR